MHQQELTFRAQSGGRTQCDRIADLRKRGLRIDHKNHRQDGTVHSYYRLNP